MVINNQQPVEFAVRMQELSINNPNVIFLVSYEAHFYLNGSVNKQNLCFWIPQNPCNLYKKSLQPKKYTPCVIARFGIAGPYFLEENNVRVTVNSER